MKKSSKLINIEQYIQQLVDEEFEEYIINSRKNYKGIKKIYRHGYYKRTIKTENGPILIKIPRCRIDKFKSLVLKKLYDTSKINNLVINTYGNGVSTSRISDILFTVFGVKVSKQTISNICKSLQSKVNDYFEKSHDEEIEIIYLDGKYFSVRDVQEKIKSPLITAIGRTKSGNYIHLHMDVIVRETKNNMNPFLKTLKNRIVNQHPLFVVDGNLNVSEAIQEVFPQSPIQRCLVHVVRNIKKKISVVADAATQKEIEIRLNKLFFKTEIEDIKECLIEIFKDYPIYTNILKNNLKDSKVWQFTKLPIELSTVIKTNNVIEQFHSNLEAVTKQHRTFSDKNSLYRAIIQEIERYSRENTNIEETRTFANEKVASSISDVFKDVFQKEYVKLKIIISNRVAVNR